MRDKTLIIVNLIEKFIICSVAVILLIFLKDVQQLRAAGIYLLFLSLYLCFKLHKNIYTFIISAFILWSNYSIVVANYFNNDGSFFVSEAYSDAAIVGMKVMLLFMSSVIVFSRFIHSIKNNESIFQNSIFQRRDPNVYISWVYIAVLLIILIMTLKSAFIELGINNTFYEYSILFFVCGFFFFRKYKPYVIISSLILLVFALSNLLRFGRVLAVALFILFFASFIHKEKNTNYKKILFLIPLFFILIIVFIGIGKYRQTGGFSFNLFKDTINTYFDESLATDTMYSAYYTSLTFIKTENILSFGDRFNIFINFCLSMFFGGSIISNSNVAVITRQYYMHYYGGFLPFFGHFFMGYTGTIIVAMIVSLYFNRIQKVNKNSKGFIKCVVLYLTSTVSRWYIYSPSNLFRGILLLAIVYYGTILVSSILDYNRQNLGIINH